MNIMVKSAILTNALLILIRYRAISLSGAPKTWTHLRGKELFISLQSHGQRGKSRVGAQRDLIEINKQSGTCTVQFAVI